MTDAWECEGDSTGSMSLNVTRVSHPPTLTRSFLFFLHHVSLPHCVWISPSTPPPLFPLSFTNQGSEKGRSDYCRTAEEDREQPQSPRFPHKEWPSTCLKKKEPNTKIPETLLLVWLLITAYSGFILKLEMEEKCGIIRMRASIVSLKDDIKS